MGIGSLRQYGYNPGQYTEALIGARRRFGDVLSRNVEKIATGIAGEVQGAVQRGKQKDALENQYAQMYMLANDVIDIIASDQKPMGAQFREAKRTGQLDFGVYKPNPDWDMETYQQKIQELNKGLSNIVRNVAGSGLLSTKQLNSLSQRFAQAGVDVDLTKPIEAARKRERRAKIAGAAQPITEQRQIEAVGAPTREQFEAGERPTRQISEERDPTLGERVEQVQTAVPDVTQKELEQDPGYAQAKFAEQQALKREQLAPTPKTPEEIAKIKAQTEAAQALTQQRKASALLNKIKANPGYMRQMDKTQLLKAETAARVALGKIPKFEVDDFGNETNEPNDEWVNMKLLADRIKSRIDESEGEGKKPTVSKQALNLTNKIKGSIRTELAEVGGESAPVDIRNRMIAKAILEHAKKIGVNIAWDGLMQALNEEHSVEEIVERVLQQAGGGGTTR